MRYYAGAFSWSAGLSRTVTKALATRRKIRLKGEPGLLRGTTAEFSAWVIVSGLIVGWGNAVGGGPLMLFKWPEWFWLKEIIEEAGGDLLSPRVCRVASDWMLFWLGKQIWCQDQTGLKVAIWLVCCIWGGREEPTALMVVLLQWKVLRRLAKVFLFFFFPVATILLGLCVNAYKRFQSWWENDYFVWTLAIDVAFVLDSWYWSLLSAFCAHSSAFCGCILKLGSMGIPVYWFVHALLSVRKYCAFSLKRKLSSCAWHEMHVPLVVDICARGLRWRSAQRWRVLSSWLHEIASTCRKVLNPSSSLIWNFSRERRKEVKFISAPKKPQEAQQIS